MGGDTRITNPTPPDYSGVMMMSSQNNLTASLAQIGSQIIGMQLMRANQKAQIAADTAVGLEKLDTKLQIAQMTYHQQMVEEDNRHQEKIGDMDLRRYEMDHPANTGFDEASFFT